MLIEGVKFGTNRDALQAAQMSASNAVENLLYVFVTVTAVLVHSRQHVLLENLLSRMHANVEEARQVLEADRQP